MKFKSSTSNDKTHAYRRTRTQHHNVYVMGRIVKRDLTVSTLFLGFGVPESGDANGYFQCLKDVVKDTLTWEELFSLTTSIVTDGENLNLGKINGLVAKL